METAAGRAKAVQHVRVARHWNDKLKRACHGVTDMAAVLQMVAPRCEECGNMGDRALALYHWIDDRNEHHCACIGECLQEARERCGMPMITAAEAK